MQNPVMPSANVIQLRQMLSEKFPGLRMHLDEPAAVQNHFWPTGLPQIDEPLRGGLPKNALTEIVSAKKSAGSATLLRQLLSRAAVENQIIALVDGGDSLDVTQIEETVLSRLLWIRCHSANEALKAADLVLRDGNLALVVLDLKTVPEKQLRKIPATTWYRFQRLVEETAAICIVLAPRPMASPAQARITLRSALSLDVLERDADEPLRELKVEAADSRQFVEAPNSAQISA